MRLTKEKKLSKIGAISSKQLRGCLGREALDNVSVADVMKETGFTHGGFHNHFCFERGSCGRGRVASSFGNAARHLSDKMTAGERSGKSIQRRDF